MRARVERAHRGRAADHVGEQTVSVAASAARGGLQVVIGQWTRYTFQLAAFVTLAHLVPRAEAGLVPMVLAIVGVAEVLRDFGLANAAMQADRLDRRQQSALFWLNTAIGATCMLVVVLAAPWIARFYDQPELTHLAIAVSSVFLINGLSAQFQVALARTLRFGPMAAADTLSMVVGLVVGVTVAVTTHSAWAYVALQIALAVSRLTLLAARSPFRPVRPGRAQLEGLLGFGRNITIVQLLDYASRNTDTVLIGRYYGPAATASYNNAYQLLMLPLQQINAPLTRVALPVLARIREDKVRYVAYIRTALMMMSLAATAIYSMLAALSGDLALVALGDQYASVGPIFQAMCLAGLAQAIGYVSYWQFMARNRTGAHLRYSLISKPLVLIGFFVAAPHGVLAVSWSYSITTAIILPAGFLVSCHGSGISGWRLLLHAVKPFPVGVVMYLAALGGSHADGTSSSAVHLLAGLAAGSVAGAAVLALVPTYRADVLRIVGLVRRREAAPPADQDAARPAAQVAVGPGKTDDGKEAPHGAGARL